jgi:hypothetical protein
LGDLDERCKYGDQLILRNQGGRPVCVGSMSGCACNFTSVEPVAVGPAVADAQHKSLANVALP